MNALAFKSGDPMPPLYPLSKSALRDLIRPDGRDWICVGSKLPPIPREQQSFEGVTSRWCVVMTNPRCEERAQSGLIDKGFGVYLPRYRMEKISRGTRKLITRNLFPRYLFCLAPHGSWPRITSTDGVQGLVREFGLHGAPMAVDDDVIKKLLDRQNAGVFDEMYSRRPGEYLKGDRVRVIKGAFFTFFAVVENAMAGKNVDILVDLFGREHKISIPLDHVESL